MLAPRHPAPPQPHTPPSSPDPHHPHHRPHHQTPPPPPQGGHPPQPQGAMPPQGGQSPQGSPLRPLITEADLDLLKEILNNDDEAQSLYAMLQNSPPEIAGLGYLVLRAFEKSKS